MIPQEKMSLNFPNSLSQIIWLFFKAKKGSASYGQEQSKLLLFRVGG